jgi:4-hydroxybenzoate polyprenyltransferase
MKIIDYLRIKDWIYYLGYTLIGSFIANSFNIFNFLATFFLLGYAYSINDYYDKKLKKKYFFIPLISYILITIFLKPISLFISILFLLIFSFYSWPKIWLEGKPILSTLSNSIGFTLLFVLPFTKIEQILYYYPLIFLIFLFNFVAQLIHEIVDFDKDIKIKKVTTTVKFGVKTSIILIKVSLIISTFFSFLLLPYFFLSSVSSFIFSIYFLLKRKINLQTRKEFKIMGIYVGIIYLIDSITLSQFHLSFN